MTGLAAAMAALTVLLGLSPSARAQSGDDAATKRHAEAKLQDGVNLLKQHRYGEALARFNEAHALVPSPLILYDVGLAEVGLGDDPEALESFEGFLSAAPGAPEDKRRKATRYRDDLRNRVAVVTLNASVAAASVHLDGRDLGRVGFPRRLYLAPGTHQLVAGAGGVTQSVTLTCIAGQPQTLSIALAEAPAGPSAPVAPIADEPRPATVPLAGSPPVGSLLQQSGPARTPVPQPALARGHRAEIWALTAAAAGAVSLGAGVTFGLLASDNAGSVTADSQNGRNFVPADEASGLRDQRLEVVFLSVGAVAVLAGLGIYAYLRYRETGGRGSQGAP